MKPAVLSCVIPFPGRLSPVFLSAAICLTKSPILSDEIGEIMRQNRRFCFLFEGFRFSSRFLGVKALAVMGKRKGLREKFLLIVLCRESLLVEHGLRVFCRTAGI
ncbi:hypothetical protein SAMN05216383_10272 [Prevotella sp. KH2C16]|nr:hypothetical protein SAMN05216383_10272 [Prevotella sp. KH2C16]